MSIRGVPPPTMQANEIRDWLPSLHYAPCSEGNFRFFLSPWLRNEPSGYKLMIIYKEARFVDILEMVVALIRSSVLRRENVDENCRIRQAWDFFPAKVSPRFSLAIILIQQSRGLRSLIFNNKFNDGLLKIRSYAEVSRLQF